MHYLAQDYLASDHIIYYLPVVELQFVFDLNMLRLVPWENDQRSQTDDGLGPIDLGLQVDQPAARQKYFLVSSVD